MNASQGRRQLADPTSRRPLRNFVLISTMVSTAYLIFIVSVLASTFIDEFNLSRFELGLIGSLNTAVGAITAPATGRLTDRIGPRLSSVTAQLIAAFGLALVALSQSVLMLVIAACILGIPQGWGNPATNALIAERVEPEALSLALNKAASRSVFFWLDSPCLAWLKLWAGDGQSAPTPLSSPSSASFPCSFPPRSLRSPTLTRLPPMSSPSHTTCAP